MGSHSKPDDITSDSEVKEFKEFTYKYFQQMGVEVRRPNGEFGCPFCTVKEDGGPADYAHLLQHAIRVGEGSISGRQRARHSAMAWYLAVDLVAELKPAPENEKTPTGRKRSRSAAGTAVKSTSTAARTPTRRTTNEIVQKLAVAEEREKEALDKIRELEKKISDMNDMMNALITKERSSNDELQLVRGELIKGLSDNKWADNEIGVLQLGELDAKVFIHELSGKYPNRESEIKGVELCSLWQKQIKDSTWYPFRIVADDNGTLQRLLNQDDKILHALKDEWGIKIHDAVVKALTDLQEHNPSGCYPVPELWNFRLERKAPLDEVIRHIIKLVAEGKGEPRTKSRKSLSPKGQ